MRRVIGQLSVSHGLWAAGEALQYEWPVASFAMVMSDIGLP
jgi:hypothetical protein